MSAFLDAAAAKAKVGVEQLQVLTLDGKVKSGRGKVRAAQRTRASKPGFEPLASPRPRAPLHPAHAARRETRAAHASHAPRLLPAPDGACIASGLTRAAACALAPRPACQAWLEGLASCPNLRTLDMNGCNLTSLDGCAARRPSCACTQQLHSPNFL